MVTDIPKLKFLEGYEKGLITEVVYIPPHVYGLRVETEDNPAEVVRATV